MKVIDIEEAREKKRAKEISIIKQTFIKEVIKQSKAESSDESRIGFLDNYEVCHDTIECLIEVLEFKDSYTSGHSKRVAHMACEIGQEYGLSSEVLERIHIAGYLHDIGKIGVPDYILNKPSQLTEEEYKEISRHSEIGYKILQKSKELRHLGLIVLHHHERWDGKGYPHKLKGIEIPIESRIIAISDTIDAMTSKRAYRTAFSWEYTKNEINKNKGTRFDPKIVDAMKAFWMNWKDE